MKIKVYYKLSNSSEKVKLAVEFGLPLSQQEQEEPSTKFIRRLLTTALEFNFMEDNLLIKAGIN